MGKLQLQTWSEVFMAGAPSSIASQKCFWVYLLLSVRFYFIFLLWLTFFTGLFFIFILYSLYNVIFFFLSCIRPGFPRMSHICWAGRVHPSQEASIGQGGYFSAYKGQLKTSSPLTYSLALDLSIGFFLSNTFERLILFFVCYFLFVFFSFLLTFCLAC